MQSEEMNLLVDCGSSSLIAMKHFGLDPSLIDIILLSHLHGDHFGGLPLFIMEAQFVSRRKKPLIVAGPPGLEKRILGTMEMLFPGLSETSWEFDLKFVELQEGIATRITSLAVTAYGVVHPSGAPSYALRIAVGDKIVAYSGDTEWTDALIPVARGADLFICDCYSFDTPSWYHIDYHTLMEHQADLECRKLVLTHMGDEMLRKIGDLDVEGAEDGKSFVL